MTYSPHTPEERAAMLAAIGAESLEELFDGIPREHRLDRPLAIPPRRTEAEILDELGRLAARNRAASQRPSFLGAGSYRRFIPSAVEHLASRGEFSTAYTPYQPEVSQGTLQAIFEYQSMIARLTGMEISNASMYEGATALAESVLMAYSIRRKGHRVIVSEGIHPEYLRVLETYLASHPIEIVRVPIDASGLTSVELLGPLITPETLAVAMQTPNFFGVIESGEKIRAALDAVELPPVFIAVVDPISLALLKPPGAYGADVAVGEGQQLGNPIAYGGPSFGFFATREAHVRKLPGRIVGETRDSEGKRGYVLTFQTREQHIRRERATSNICTNQGLCCLRGAMYLTLLGETGLREVASVSARRARYARAALTAIPSVRAVYQAPVFCELTLELPLPAETMYRELDRAGIGGGLPLGRYFPGREREMLFAFTELTTKADIDRLTESVAEICRRAPVQDETNRRTSATENALEAS